MRQFQDAISLAIKDKSTEPQVFGTLSLHSFLWENDRSRNLFPIRACSSEDHSLLSFAPVILWPPQEQHVLSWSPPHLQKPTPFSGDPTFPSEAAQGAPLPV